MLIHNVVRNTKQASYDISYKLYHMSYDRIKWKTLSFFLYAAFLYTAASFFIKYPAQKGNFICPNHVSTFKVKFRF